MSSANLPDKIAGFGIYDEDASRLISGANPAFFYYGSSDGWGGQGRVRYEPLEARTDSGTCVEIPEGLPWISMFTYGHLIVTTALDELDELEAGITVDGGEALPPLKDANVIVRNGTSGGANGAIRHADGMTKRVAANGTEVVSSFDAALSPPYEDEEELTTAAVRVNSETTWQPDGPLPTSSRSWRRAVRGSLAGPPTLGAAITPPTSCSTT